MPPRFGGQDFNIRIWGRGADSNIQTIATYLIWLSQTLTTHGMHFKVFMSICNCNLLCIFILLPSTEVLIDWFIYVSSPNTFNKSLLANCESFVNKHMTVEDIYQTKQTKTLSKKRHICPPPQHTHPFWVLSAFPYGWYIAIICLNTLTCQ